jgi:glutamyl-tRNA reductase
LFLIDIAVPRDVDPEVNELDGVYLYDVDDLSRIVAESLEGRATEAVRAESIVNEETTSFEHRTAEREVTPTITKMFARTRSVLEAELERSLSGRLKHLGAAEKEALAAMIGAATNKILHGPTRRLRELAGDPRADLYVEALHELFELGEGEVSAGHRADPEPPRVLAEIDEEVRAHDGRVSRAIGAEVLEAKDLWRNLELLRVRSLKQRRASRSKSWRS